MKSNVEQKKSSKRNGLACRRSPLVIVWKTAVKLAPLFLFLILVKTCSINDFYISSFCKNSSKTLYRVASIIFVLECFRAYFNDLYIVGNKRAISFQGLLALRFKRSSIAFEDIREVKVKQSVWGRIFHHGTLKIGTSSTKDYEIIFEDVLFVRSLRYIIEDKRDKRVENSITEAAEQDCVKVSVVEV